MKTYFGHFTNEVISFKTSPRGRTH